MTNAERELQQNIKILMRWRESLEHFVEEALGIDGRNGYAMSTQQREGAREISNLVNAKVKKNVQGLALTPDEEKYAKKIGVSIMSGQGPGKDGLAAWTVMWWLFCFINTLIPCTAPGADQLRNILWAEISRWKNRRGNDGEYLVIPEVRDKIEIQSDKIYHADYKGKENFAFAKTCNPKDDAEAQAKTLYGFHAPYMMIIVEEASHVLEPVFKPLEGTMTGDCNFALLLFNPVYNKGYAYDTHYGKHREKYICLHWDAEESEIVNKDKIESMADTYGRSSNTFRCLVKGLPPISSPDALIPLDWIERAIATEVVPEENDPVIGGCDPGAGGDNTVLFVRKGRKHIKTLRYSSPDTTLVAEWLEARAIEEELDVLYVLSVGIGNGVYFHCKKSTGLRAKGCKVYQVKESWKARDEDRFPNRRHELWWKAREALEDGTFQLLDEGFIKEELSVVQFKHEGKRIDVDNKATMKKRLSSSHSPNDADAFIATLDKPDFLFSRQGKGSDYDHDELAERRQMKRVSWMAA